MLRVWTEVKQLLAQSVSHISFTFKPTALALLVYCAHDFCIYPSYFSSDALADLLNAPSLASYLFFFS